MSYDKTLFSGTASYYSKYRFKYPKKLYEEIFKHLKTKPRLLDLGCGPATITLDIYDKCEGIVCVDPDKEMLTEGRRLLTADENVNWVQSTAERLKYDELGKFDLVTIGAALHWMDSNFVLNKIAQNLNLNGLIAVLSTNSVGMNIWQEDIGQKSWQLIVTNVIKKYLGKDRRAGTKNFNRVRNVDSFEASLMKTTSLNRFIQINVPFLHNWTIDGLVGILYSGSFCRRDYFKDEMAIKEFESELEQEVKKFWGGKGTWTEKYVAQALLGIRDT